MEHQPLPITLSWDEAQGVDAGADGANSVVMFSRGLNFPIVRRVTLKRKGEFRVHASYDKTAADFGFESGSTVSIASWTIKAPVDSEQKVRVNVKADIHGIVQMSTAQMVEEIEGETKEEEAKEGDKKKVKKTNLEYTVTKPLEWSKEEINRFHEIEVAMANKDRIVRETSDMRNELESYIYDMRDKMVSESQLGNYATDAEKEAFSKKNEEMENWLYEDGFDATKSVYAAKLEELKKLGGPVEARAAEAFTRPEAVSSLQKNVEKYKAWLAEAQGNENYSHITEEEFQKCHAKCDETSSWVYEMMDKQGALPANVNPVFAVAECRTKSVDLTNLCGPIMHKPKPKPLPKVDPPKPAEAPAEKKDGEPMETDEAPAENGEKMETEESM
jgi:heat shock protein 4